jgi:hypothetical protein
MASKNKLVKLNDRELQLIQHALEHMGYGFTGLFSMPELGREISNLKEKIEDIRNDLPKVKKGWCRFKASNGYVTFKKRRDK